MKTILIRLLFVVGRALALAFLSLASAQTTSPAGHVHGPRNGVGSGAVGPAGLDLTPQEAA